MDSQPPNQQTAIQEFKEFTGSESDGVAKRVLNMCGWDLQRAINVYFMRGAQLEQEEVEIAHSPPVRRISHYAKRQQNTTVLANNRAQRGRQNDEAAGNFLDDSVQVIGGNDDSDIQMLDNSTSDHQNGQSAVGMDDEIRAPIPAVQGVLLAQSYRQTYQNGDASTRPANPFLQQFHAANGDENDELDGMEATSSSSSAAQPQSVDFKQLQAAHRAAAAKLTQKRNQQQAQPNDEERGGNGEGIVGRWTLPTESTANNGQQQFRQPLQEMEIGAAAMGTTTGNNNNNNNGGFGQAVPRRDLRILFRPPVDMIFYGDWDQAIQAARQKHFWLLVNIQHSGEFASAALNRDIWSSEMVKELVKGNFLFWQIYQDSADGQRVQGYYGFHSYPTIFIVDPRTGEEVKKLEGGDVVKFLDDLTAFLQRYPTFEARDQEFRDIAAKVSVPQSPPPPPSSILPTATASESMTSPLGGKKRKQPTGGGPRIGNGELAGNDGDEKETDGAIWCEGGQYYEEDDDSSREANRQAKKMKRVVKISDIDETMQPSSSNSMLLPSSSSSASIWAKAPKKMVEIEPNEWQKWRVAENTSQTEMARVQLQFRLPNGVRERICLWAQAPLRALFSVIASHGLDPHAQMLVLDFPRREFTTTGDNAFQLDRSLGELGFGRQEMVNVEKRVQ